MKIIRIRNRKQSTSFSVFFRTIRENKLSLHSTNFAYTLLFSLFPLLMVISFFVGKLDLASPTAEQVLQKILPESLLELLRGIIGSNELILPTQLAGGILLSGVSCFKIAASLREKIRGIYRLKPRKSPFGELVVSCVFALLLLLGIFLSLVVLVAGEQLIRLLSSFLSLTPLLLRLWSLARYALVAAFIFVVFFMIYRYVPGIPLRTREVVVGALFSTVTWVLLSAVFSFYVDNLHDYSVIYGSLGVAMILLLWLYLSGFILLTGATINAFVRAKSNR